MVTGVVLAPPRYVPSFLLLLQEVCAHILPGVNNTYILVAKSLTEAFTRSLQRRFSTFSSILQLRVRCFMLFFKRRTPARVRVYCSTGIVPPFQEKQARLRYIKHLSPSQPPLQRPLQGAGKPPAVLRGGFSGGGGTTRLPFFGFSLPS